MVCIAATLGQNLMLGDLDYHSLEIYPVVIKIIYTLFQDKPLPRRPFLSSSSFSSADHNNSSITERFVVMWWLPFHFYCAPNLKKLREHIHILLQACPYLCHQYHDSKTSHELTLWHLGNFSFFFFLASAFFFFKINYFEKFFREYYQSVKQFGYRSGLTKCWAWSGSKLFAKVISSRH